MKKTTILFILLASSFLLVQASDQAQQELKQATTNHTLPKGVEIDDEGYEFGPKVDYNVDHYNQDCDYTELNDPSIILYATPDGQLNQQELKQLKRLKQLEQAAQQATNAQDNDSDDDEGDLPMSYTVGGNFGSDKKEDKLTATLEQVFNKGYTQAPAPSQVRTSYDSL